MKPERIAELRALRAMSASGEWKADTHGVVVADGDADLGTWRVCKTEFIGTAIYIAAAIPEQCRHPEHKPAMAVCLPPAVYEHRCPGCGATMRFTVPRVTCGGER
jgi:hypothetical protein